MDKGALLQEQREVQRKRALEEHKRMTRLFREDRFEFERQRREAVSKLIESAPDPQLRRKLWDMQERWEQRMQSAGSPHNRLVLARAFFWDHVVNHWLPALNQFAASLKELNTVATPMPNPNRDSSL